MAAFSMNMPSSVLALADRGSRFIEPTKHELAVDHRRLGVQPAKRIAELPRRFGLLRPRRAQLVEVDAGLEHAGRYFE
jgi:hypothetical protein